MSIVVCLQCPKWAHIIRMASKALVTYFLWDRRWNGASLLFVSFNETENET